LNYLSNKHILLVLDNCARLQPIIDLLNAIVQKASDIKIVVGSEDEIGIKHEYVLDQTMLDTKHAENLLRRGLADYRRLNTPLSFYAYTFVLEQMQGGRVNLQTTMHEMWQASRASAFQKRLFYRLMVVIGLSPIMALQALVFVFIFFRFYSEYNNFVTFPLLVGVISIFINAIAVSVYSGLDYFEVNYRKRQWMFPLILGLIEMPIFMLPVSNYQPLEGAVMGMIFGSAQGLVYNTSLTTLRNSVWWKDLRRGLFISLIVSAVVAVFVGFVDDRYEGQRWITVFQVLVYIVTYTLIYVSAITQVDRKLLSRQTNVS
jgi:hypothetical protein